MTKKYIYICTLKVPNNKHIAALVNWWGEGVLVVFNFLILQYKGDLTWLLILSGDWWMTFISEHFSRFLWYLLVSLEYQLYQSLQLVYTIRNAAPFSHITGHLHLLASIDINVQNNIFILLYKFLLKKLL